MVEERLAAFEKGLEAWSAKAQGEGEGSEIVMVYGAIQVCLLNRMQTDRYGICHFEHITDRLVRVRPPALCWRRRRPQPHHNRRAARRRGAGR